MKRRAGKPRVSFDDLPLFVGDDELAEAVVGPDAERKQVWLAGVPQMEAAGFPRKVGFGRYRPAVKAYYDRFYCADSKPGAQPVQGRQEEGTWERRTARRPARA